MLRWTLFVVAVSAAPVPPTEVVVVNKAKDIHVVSDRDETTREFFNRSHILVGGLQGERLKAVVAAKEPVEKVFVNYASFNDDLQKMALFGAEVTIAVPTEAVRKLLDEQKEKSSLTLVLRRVDGTGKTYAVVGVTGRTPVQFFNTDTVNEADGYSNKELRFAGKK